jgi:hypothetical protein
MSASAVHFRGIESVVTAYRSNRVGPWAIHNGKCVLFSSEDVGIDDVESGAEQLRGILKLMAGNGSESKMMLAVYKIDEQTEITNKTEFFRSFNFTLYGVDEESPYVRRGSMISQEINQRMDRLEALVLKLVEEEEEEEEEKEPGLMGVLNGLSKNPQVMQVVTGFIMNKLGIVPPGGQLGKVAGMDNKSVGSMQSAPSNVLNQEQTEKAQRAIEILVGLDPDLGDHLLKIADIAKNQPVKYKMFASML